MPPVATAPTPTALLPGAVRGTDAWCGLVAPAGWRLATFRGRLSEISGSRACASLSLVFRLVLEAQREAEPVAWVGRRESVFYPPDVADTGVDLEALAVVWAPATRLAARAADHLLRSGGFGLVVLDVGPDDRLPPVFQTRLAGLAHRHDAALVCLTEKDGRRPSLGSLVSLRTEAVRTARTGDRFRCEVRVLKDKRRGPGWTHIEVFRGPDGLC
jgi:recombination protein RecA